MSTHCGTLTPRGVERTGILRMYRHVEIEAGRILFDRTTKLKLLQICCVPKPSAGSRSAKVLSSCSFGPVTVFIPG